MLLDNLKLSPPKPVASRFGTEDAARGRIASGQPVANLVKLIVPMLKRSIATDRYRPPISSMVNLIPGLAATQNPAMNHGGIDARETPSRP